jgi:predicted ester cyclase
MSTEDHKADVRRLTEEVWNQGNSALRDEVVAPYYVGRHPSLTIQGPEGLRQFVSQYRSAFPDIHFTIEDMLAVGDKVVVRWSVTGTHEG